MIHPEAEMASQHLFPILLAVLFLASHAGASGDGCSLDSTASYQPPHSCGSKSSSNSSYGGDVDAELHREILYDAAASPPQPHPPHPPHPCDPSPPSVPLLKCCLKFEYVYSEYLSRCVYGYGLSEMDSSLGNGTVKGGQRVALSQPTYDMVDSIAKTSVDNIRALRDTLGNDTEPDIDISKDTFANTFDKAVGFPAWPRFDTYKDENSFLLGGYWFIGILTKCYVGVLDRVEGPITKRLAGSLAAAKAEQEAVTRSLLYQRMHQQVDAYRITIFDATNRISKYRDQLLNSTGVSDEGLNVPSCIATGDHGGNLFSLDDYGLPYGLKVDSACTVADVLKDFVK